MIGTTKLLTTRKVTRGNVGLTGELSVWWYLCFGSVDPKSILNIASWRVECVFFMTDGGKIGSNKFGPARVWIVENIGCREGWCIQTLSQALYLCSVYNAKMSSSSVDMSRSVVSADECNIVPWRISTDDLPCTAATSSGEASSKPIIFDKWSLKPRRISKIAGAALRPCILVFWCCDQLWSEIWRRGTSSDSTIVIQLSQRGWLVLVALSRSAEAVTSWAATRGTTAVARLWGENSFKPFNSYLSTPNVVLNIRTCRRTVLWQQRDVAVRSGAEYEWFSLCL